MRTRSASLSPRSLCDELMIVPGQHTGLPESDQPQTQLVGARSRHGRHPTLGGRNGG
jgi:hypothetical protein